MTRVKICGIQQLDHALVAAEAGAEFIGLVFVPHRRRKLALETARDIVAGLKKHSGQVPQVVGLFADQALEEVNQTIQTCSLDAAQLCGKESNDYCQQVQAQVIKVLHVRPSADNNADEVVSELATTAHDYLKTGHLVTLDRLVEGLQGGTGQSFDWEIAAQLSRQGLQFLLAGGLTPDNVAQAVAAVQPWGVDVSSGVETGGVKDPDKIRAFINNVRRLES